MKAKLLNRFLRVQLNEKIGEYPIKLRKLIKLTKVLLEEPSLLFIDQKALEFSDQPYDFILEILEEIIP